MSKIKDATANSSTQCKCSVRIKRKLTGSIVFHLSKRANYVPYGYLGPGTVFTGQNTLIFAASIAVHVRTRTGKFSDNYRVYCKHLETRRLLRRSLRLPRR